MTLPAAWTRIPITGKFLRLDGTPAVGAVIRFEVVQDGLVIQNTSILRSELSTRLDADGAVPADFTLPATNDPDLSVVNWTYMVFEEFEGGRPPYTIAVPYDASSVDLNTATDTPPSPTPTDEYLRESDIGVVVASEQAVEDAQADADAAAATAAAAAGAAAAHAARTDNPHGTTAAQVGALPTAEKGADDGVCELVAGKVPVARLPAIAISEVFVVNSQAAQLALAAEEGDFAVRTDPDPHETYIHNGGTSGTMADWTIIALPDAAAMLAAHVAAGNPHAQYILATMIGAASGVAPLNADARLDPIYRAKKRVTVAPVAGVLTLDLATLDDAYIALSGNVSSTVVTNGPPAGYVREGTLTFAQDATGGRTWAPPAGAKWPNGLAAVLTATANAVDHIGYRVYNNAGSLEYTFYPVRDVR